VPRPYIPSADDYTHFRIVSERLDDPPFGSARTVPDPPQLLRIRLGGDGTESHYVYRSEVEQAQRRGELERMNVDPALLQLRVVSGVSLTVASSTRTVRLLSIVRLLSGEIYWAYPVAADVIGADLESPRRQHELGNALALYMGGAIQLQSLLINSKILGSPICLEVVPDGSGFKAKVIIPEESEAIGLSWGERLGDPLV